MGMIAPAASFPFLTLNEEGHPYFASKVDIPVEERMTFLKFWLQNWEKSETRKKNGEPLVCP